jgi:NADH dehydrogenase FAD-containing subunit
MVSLFPSVTGFRMAKDTSSKDYDITVVSPRNHFLFTPLLPSTTVGTLEFRAIIEPIRHAQKDLHYFQAAAQTIDPIKREIKCSGYVRVVIRPQWCNLTLIAKCV